LVLQKSVFICTKNLLETNHQFLVICKKEELQISANFATYKIFLYTIFQSKTKDPQKKILNFFGHF